MKRPKIFARIPETEACRRRPAVLLPGSTHFPPAKREILCFSRSAGELASHGAATCRFRGRGDLGPSTRTRRAQTWFPPCARAERTGGLPVGLAAASRPPSCRPSPCSLTLPRPPAQLEAPGEIQQQRSSPQTNFPCPLLPLGTRHSGPALRRGPSQSRPPLSGGAPPRSCPGRSLHQRWGCLADPRSPAPQASPSVSAVVPEVSAEAEVSKRARKGGKVLPNRLAGRSRRTLLTWEQHGRPDWPAGRKEGTARAAPDGKMAAAGARGVECAARKGERHLSALRRKGGLCSGCSGISYNFEEDPTWAAWVAQRLSVCLWPRA